MTNDHLVDGLARLARRQEMTRRLGSATSGGVAPAQPPSWPLETPVVATAGEVTAVDEVAAAVGRVVERHPGASVVLTVQDRAGAWLVRVDWRDGSVRTSTTPVEPAVSAGTGADLPDDRPAAARLAELLRADPYMLEREGPTA
jgi:hypothetical protein